MFSAAMGRVYDRADEEARAILPLIRIWWPA